MGGNLWFGQILPGPLGQGQTKIAKFTSAYNGLIIVPRGMGW